MDRDPALLALEGLTAAIARTRAALDAMEERAATLRAAREQGRTFVELLAEEDHPLLVEMITSLLDDVAESGAAFRRAKARALHDEGLSQEVIAQHFGVTRQRIAALLQERRRDGG